MNSKKAIFVCRAAVVAALYVVFTLIAQVFGLASGVIQVRVSEALCILPVFTFAAVPGLFVGCIISNLICGAVVWDVLFGSLATLIAAIVTYLMRNVKNKVWCTVSPVAANTLIVPFVLRYAYGAPGALWYFAITVCIGEIISCCVFGTILYKSLLKYEKYLG